MLGNHIRRNLWGLVGDFVRYFNSNETWGTDYPHQCSQILANPLTLSPPGLQIIAPTFLLATPDFQTYVAASLIILKFIYSEKATKFCEIFPLLLTTVHTFKSKGKISQNFVAFSEYMNFKINS